MKQQTIKLNQTLTTQKTIQRPDTDSKMKFDSNHCGKCGSPRYKLRFNNCDYISGETFEIAQCVQCGLVRTLLPDSAFDLNRYYGSAYYGHEGRRFPEIMEKLILTFRRRRARYIQRLKPIPGKILDIGCGRGWMLAELKQCGWECVGTETDKELADSVKKQHGFDVIVASNICGEFPEASFDVITLWHALEHTPAPVETIQEVRHLLKPGGFAIIETPNFISLQALLGAGRWFHLDAPRHQYHFSTSSLASILKEQGFEIIHKSTFSLEQGFFGFYQTILNLITRKPNVLFTRLKGNPHVGRNIILRRLGLDNLLTILALPLAITIGTPLEIAAVASGRGGVTRLTVVHHAR